MPRNTFSNIQFTDEEKKKLNDEITFFFREEMEQELGVIATGKVLDFFLENLGNLIYNKALDDTQMWFKQAAENMEADFYSLYKSEGKI